jgi:Tfp pilus assembly protein PilF
MGRSPDEPVTRSIAREIARREQLKALLAGSIARLGRNYVIALEVVNAESGDTMAREQIAVASQEEVLSALGTAVAGMRESLGESLASVKRFDAPLARATTSSLEALNAYSLALDHGSVNPRPEAIPHLRRAIELDPDFALALAFMATVYSNNGQTALASDFARRAFELRDRVSERERYFIAFRYYRDATQDWEKALDLARSWTATYPREAFAFNSLGTAYMRFGQNEAAIEPFRTAMRLDRSFQPPYANLTTTLIALNRYDEAAQVIEYARAQGIEFSSARRHSYTLAFIAGDAAKMREALEPALEARDATAMGWQAHTSAFAGQVTAAHDRFQRGIQMAIQQGLREVAAQMTAEDAEVHALAGQCGDTRRELAEAVALSRDNYTLERGSRAIAFCGDEGETTTLSRELTRQFPESVLTTRVALPITSAALALAQNAPARTLSLLESVRPYESAQRAELWPAYLRGLAHLQLKAGADAATEFQSVIDRRGEDPESQLFPLAHLGLARAKLLTSDTAAARRFYARFLELWRDADAALPALVSARQEQQRCCL